VLDVASIVSLSLLLDSSGVHDLMDITKLHTDKYYGEYVGPEGDGEEAGYLDPNNYKDLLIQVEFVVIHCTEGFEEGDRKTLSGNTERRVSAHYYVTKKGEVIEFVDPSRRAWHAGRSRYELEGKNWVGFNNFSIGIELENRYVEDPYHGTTEYTTPQIEALFELHKSLQERFPTLRDPQRTVGHEDISGYRGKKDPGPAFDWFRFREAAFQQELPPPPFSVKVNGKLLHDKLAIIDGRSYLPVRPIAEACGLKVLWFNKEKRVELVSVEDVSSD